MLKVLVNREPVEGPWGGGNHFVRILFSEAENHGIEICTKISRNIDAILVVDPRPDSLGISLKEIAKLKKRNPGIRVIHRVNECDARKGESGIVDPLLQEVSKISNVSIFGSQWLMDYHQDNGWYSKKSIVVINGVSDEFIGVQRDESSEVTRIVTHHWSNNWMKGFDYYEMLDRWLEENPGYVFNYIGRDRGTFRNTNVLPAMSGMELAGALVNNDIYISASRWDPGPNHILESLACGLPTYAYREGGGSVEMVGKDHVFDCFEALETILIGGDYSKNKAIQVRPWSEVITQYFTIIKECVYDSGRSM